MEVKSIDDVTVIGVGKRVDAYIAREMEAALGDLFERDIKKLLFDFSQTEYISSTGLRLLIATAKKIQASGGELILCSLKPFVREVFRMAGITHIFNITDSEEGALKSFK